MGLWDALRSDHGWVAKKGTGLESWYWVRPGGRVPRKGGVPFDATRGRSGMGDFFTDLGEVMAFVRASEGNKSRRVVDDDDNDNDNGGGDDNNDNDEGGGKDDNGDDNGEGAACTASSETNYSHAKLSCSALCKKSCTLQGVPLPLHPTTCGKLVHESCGVMSEGCSREWTDHHDGGDDYDGDEQGNDAKLFDIANYVGCHSASQKACSVCDGTGGHRKQCGWGWARRHEIRRGETKLSHPQCKTMVHVSCAIATGCKHLGGTSGNEHVIPTFSLARAPPLSLRLPLVCACARTRARV